MLELSELITLILVIAAFVLAIWRLTRHKITGEEPQSKFSEIFSQFREDIVDGLIKGKKLIDLEKEQGREAVRQEIHKTVNGFLDSTIYLTEQEKQLIRNTKYVDKIVDAIEKELVKRGILKPEESDSEEDNS